jgi:hypothetical protein
MRNRNVTIAGRVAYDVENAEWVMYRDDRFVPMEPLYAALNAELARLGQPPLQVGDELTVEIRRSAQNPLSV